MEKEGTQFTCFTSTMVPILTPEELLQLAKKRVLTYFTSTKVLALLVLKYLLY